MSSPRVLRTVVTMPASSSTLANAAIAASGDRRRPDCGNGLNGIRLSLQESPAQRLSFTSSINCRACSGWSFTPSSMQYSKVMKSRGAASRYRLAAPISSASGYLRLSGTKVSRSASLEACSEIASATGQSAASRSIMGTTPDVDTVTRRRDRP